MSDPDEPHRIRVRYCETDRMGVAHHGSYVAWFEEARTEWLRRRGKTYRAMEDEGNLLQIVELCARYRRSVTYDDVLLVSVNVKEKGRVWITLGYEVRDEATGEICCTGHTKLACVGRDGRVRPLPPEFEGMAIG
ncbi:MAG: thioesterase family protein [Planctomycetota bacterium]